MPKETRIHSGQDSFLDALHSEIISGSENLAAWIKHIHAQGGIDDLFRLETWLKGVRSFFILEHLPLSGAEKSALVNRNFAPEIQIVYQALHVCEAYACEVIKLGSADRLEFEEFIEAQMRKDSILDFHIGRIVEQIAPMDSVSQLLESLNDLRIMIDAFKSQSHQSYQLFLSLGRCFRRDLKNCRYIDMLISQRFRLQYDLVDNKPLTDALHSIEDEQVRRNVALALLYLFRFLKYLKLISKELGQDRPLRRQLVIFALLHEEMGHLSDFLKSRFLKGREPGQALRNAAELIAYSLRMESQRLRDRELVFVAREIDASPIYTRIENSHGLLRNCCQSCIVTLIQAIDKGFDCAALFPSRAASLVEAEKLRQDLWNLRQFLVDMLNNRAELDSNKIIELLTSFKDASLHSLMYRDWEEFDAFLDSLALSSNFIEIRTQMRKFVGFIETLTQEVSKRSVFQEKQPGPQP